MSARRCTRAAASLTLALGALSSAAAATFTPAIDEFWILEGSGEAAPAEIFRDSFADGVLPPAGPDGASTYVVHGAAGMTAEAAGKLTMTPSLGEAVLITTTYADVSTGAIRAVATNPANPDFLGRASAFEIHGLYDLTSLPTVAGQSFGIRASDRAPALGNEGNGTYFLFMGVNPDTGERHVTLRINDFTTNTSTVLGSALVEELLPGADQIEFVLAKAAGADTLSASYRLFDHALADPLLASGPIAAGKTLRLYDGETYVRAQVETTDRLPIPEPSTPALLGLGLLGIAGVRRRRGRAR
jgi:hypothetical protein